MSTTWLREDQADLAVDKILDAAGKAFAERGVSATGMAEIARSAGCSRGTLYRYFKSRHELHVAFVNREGSRIAGHIEEELAGIRDPRKRLVEAIARSVREVRSRPETAAFFAPADSGNTARLSRRSEVIVSSASSVLMGADPEGQANRLRARWLVRIIVSLLTLPGENEAEERALIERFVVPGVIGDTD
jgi:AcrR family transcriptional regulator